MAVWDWQMLRELMIVTMVRFPIVTVRLGQTDALVSSLQSDRRVRRDTQDIVIYRRSLDLEFPRFLSRAHSAITSRWEGVKWANGKAALLRWRSGEGCRSQGPTQAGDGRTSRASHNDNRWQEFTTSDQSSSPGRSRQAEPFVLLQSSSEERRLWQIRQRSTSIRSRGAAFLSGGSRTRRLTGSASVAEELSCPTAGASAGRSRGRTWGRTCRTGWRGGRDRERRTNTWDGWEDGCRGRRRGRPVRRGWNRQPWETGRDGPARWCSSPRPQELGECTFDHCAW